MSKFCPDCGKEVTPGQKFCVSCGKPLPETPSEAIEATTPQASPPAAPPATTPMPVVPPLAGTGGPGKKQTGLWIGIGVGAAVLLAIILTVVLVFAVGGKKNGDNKKVTTVSVPEVVGLSEAEARGEIEDAKLEFDPIYKTDNNVEKGKVTDQRPDAGKKIKKGERVTVVVAVRGQVDVPDFVGQTQDQALVMLTKTLLNFKLTQQPTGDQSQHGKIISQTPSSGTKVDAGTEIAIVVGVYQGPAAQPQPTSKKGYWATRQVQCNVCGGEGVIWSGDQTITCQVCGGAGGSYVPDYDEDGNYIGDVWATCDECGGAGYVIIPGDSTTCTNCGGSGWVAQEYWVEQ